MDIYINLRRFCVGKNGIDLQRLLCELLFKVYLNIVYVNICKLYIYIGEYFIN